jgi:subtilisin family serine protease
VLCVVALASSVDGAGAAERRVPLELLCGIAPPIDVLLHCVPPSVGVPATQPETQPETQHSSPAPEPPKSSTTPRYVDDLLLVKFRANASAREQDDVLREAGVDTVKRIAALHVVVVQMPPSHRDEALAKLREASAVAFAERDAVMEQLATTPNDASWPLQWGLRQVGYPSAWDTTRGGDSITIAVLDTGIDGTVPDLRSAVVDGYNAVDPQAAPTDDNGHGTSVAGILGARSNNLEGITGVCWTCSLMPIKVLGASGAGDTALVAAGIVHAVDAGARIITMSLGGPADESTLDQAVSYALTRGAILVAAAGNSGTSEPFYPAAIPGVLSVAATDPADHLYSWSNFGDWVDVAAPGCNPAPSFAGGYVQLCGTSSATPVVAGLVALVLSIRPTASRDAVIDLIESSAVPIGSSIAHGRIDAASALATLAPASSTSAATRPSAAPRSSSTVTLRGLLSRTAPSRTYRRVIARGETAAVLRFDGQRMLGLSVRSARGTTLARVRGRSPLRLSRDLPAGTYDFVVNGRRARAAFRLVLTERAAP